MRPWAPEKGKPTRSNIVNIFKRVIGGVGGFLIMTAVIFNGQAMASGTKIGVIDMKQVVTTSIAGKKAQGIIEDKMKSLQGSFKKDENDLITLNKEMEVKGSAWSDAVKREKATAFAKKRNSLAAKQEKANTELKKLREIHVNPILKKLEEIVEKIATDDEYAIILPRNSVLYSSKTIDISDKVIAELNKSMK